MAGLVERKLLKRSSVDKALNYLGSIPVNQKSKGRLDIGVTFTKNQLNRIFSAIPSQKTTKPCSDKCHLPNEDCLSGSPYIGCGWVLNTVANVHAEVLPKFHTDLWNIFAEKLEDIVDVLEIQGGIAGGIRAMSPSAEYDYRFYENKRAYLTDEETFNEFIDFLRYRRYGAMALFEIFTHMKALSESMILPAGSNVQPPVLETGWDQKSLLHHQSHIVRIMGCWWDYTFELRNDLLLTNKMRSINIALFESLVKLARGPDQTGSAPELWATFSLPDKNNPDVMLPMILT